MNCTGKVIKSFYYKKFCGKINITTDDHLHCSSPEELYFNSLIASGSREMNKKIMNVSKTLTRMKIQLLTHDFI